MATTTETATGRDSRTVLEIEGLSVAYRTEEGDIFPVRDVSLTIAKGESFGLVGESGSGKSTLAMGAIRYLAANGRVTSGRVLLGGQDLLSLSDKEMRSVWGSRVAVVYQSPGNALNPSIRTGNQIAEVARIHLGMSKQEANERMLEMLEKVKMPDPESVARRYPHQLSGGMLQRCVVAQAMMTNPELLIMDEPTTALDVTTQAVVLDLVAELKQEFDSAILYITHDLGVVARVCDRVGVMYAGEFMEQGGIHDLFKRPLHPYTLNLLGCVPHFSLGPRRKTLNTIPGFIPRLDELPEGCIFAPRCSLGGARVPSGATAFGTGRRGSSDGLPAVAGGAHARGTHGHHHRRSHAGARGGGEPPARGARRQEVLPGPGSGPLPSGQAQGQVGGRHDHLDRRRKDPGAGGRKRQWQDDHGPDDNRPGGTHGGHHQPAR